MNKGILIAIVSIVLLGAVFALELVHYSNKEIKLRNRVAAEQEANEVDFDKTWKVIKQQAQVTDEYRDSFKDVYVEMMSERYDNARGGSLMSWVQESNPTLDSSIYKQLMTTIEAQREGFNRRQIKLRDIKREHDDLIGTFPGSLFLASREPVEVKLVTSSKTKETFETGVEDDVDLFGSDEKAQGEAGG